MVSCGLDGCIFLGSNPRISKKSHQNARIGLWTSILTPLDLKSYDICKNSRTSRLEGLGHDDLKA
jgi:hypothetical protein